MTTLTKISNARFTNTKLVLKACLNKTPLLDFPFKVMPPCLDIHVRLASASGFDRA